MIVFLTLLAVWCAVGATFEIPGCARHCIAQSYTGTNCQAMNWNCMCFAEIYMNQFSGCVDESCDAKERTQAYGWFVDACRPYEAPMTGPYASATSVLATATVESTSAVNDTTLPEHTETTVTEVASVMTTETVGGSSTTSPTDATSSTFAVSQTTPPANTSAVDASSMSANVSVVAPSSMSANISIDLSVTSMLSISIPTTPHIVSNNSLMSPITSVPANVTASPAGYNTTGINATHTHTHGSESISSTAPTLSDPSHESTSHLTSSASTATPTASAVPENPNNSAPAAAATTTASSAEDVKTQSKLALAALAFVGCVMSGL